MRTPIRGSGFHPVFNHNEICAASEIHSTITTKLINYTHTGIAALAGI